MTNLTLLILGNRADLEISAYPHEGLFGFLITLGEGDRYRPIVTATPVYNSAVDAEQAARRLVEDCRRVADGALGELKELLG